MSTLGKIISTEYSLFINYLCLLQILEIPTYNNEEEDNHDPHEAQPAESDSPDLYGHYVKIDRANDQHRIFIPLEDLLCDRNPTIHHRPNVLLETATNNNEYLLDEYNVVSNDLTDVNDIPKALNKVE